MNRGETKNFFVNVFYFGFQCIYFDNGGLDHFLPIFFVLCFGFTEKNCKRLHSASDINEMFVKARHLGFNFCFALWGVG